MYGQYERKNKRQKVSHFIERSFHSYSKMAFNWKRNDSHEFQNIILFKKDLQF